MWKNLVLHRLLQICSNSEDSCNDAVKFLKCQPKCEDSDRIVDYEIVHFHGVLRRKRDDLWYIQNGFEDVQIEITSETVGFRTITNLAEPVHIFAAIPILDPDADFATYVEDDDTWEISIAMLITSDNIYQMVNALKTIEEKHRALSEFYFLPIDQKTTVYRFMTDHVFAKNLVKCCGFMASARIDPWFYSDRNDNLIEQYNELTGTSIKIDMYRVLSFLDIVGDVILLSENSATLLSPPSWLSFLGTYALTERCSVWSIPGKSLTQTILKEVPHNFFVPTYMLCWILNSTEQNQMIKELLKCKVRKRQNDIRTRLIHLLYYGSGLKVAEIHSILRHLMKAGLTDMELETLTSGNSAAVVKNFLRTEYGFSP